MATTIKVTYNSIARRFNLSSSTNWDELESKLRSLYNIPTTSLLTVSYTDEDGDVITLSSDLELKEVLSQQTSGRPVKFVLNTVNDWVLEDNNVVDNADNVDNIDNVDNTINVDDESSNVEVNNNIVVDSTTLQQEQQIAERKEENIESRPPSYYQHVSFNDEEDEPEYVQSTPLLNKEKETEKQNLDNNNKNVKTQTEKENKEEKNKDNEKEDDDNEDEIIFIISYRPTFFGPRFGLFGGPRFGLFGGPRYCPFNSFNYYGRPQCYRPTFFNGYSGPSAYYYGPNSCDQKFNTCNGNSKPSCYSKSDSFNKNAEASTSKNNCRRGSRPSCGQNSNFFHPRYYNQVPITQEQLNDKLTTLYSMGFDHSNDTLYKDLLKRYNGNLERVIELLLRNQQINDHYDNEEVGNEGKDNEGSSSNYKPYIL